MQTSLSSFFAGPPVVLATLLLCAITGLSNAEELAKTEVKNAGISMTAAVQAAIAWHPSVRMAQGQLLGADEGIAVAKAGYKPQVSGGIGSQTSNNVIAPYSSRHIYDARISASQMIYDFGKVDSAVEQAEAAVSTAQAQVQLSSEDVARETALAWVEVRRQQALVEVANAQVIGVKALADLALERQIKGASTKSDSVQAQSRVESAAATAINYEAQAQRWRVRLMYLIGAKKLPLVSSELPTALPLACSASNDGPNALLPAAVLKAIGQRDLAKADMKAADAQLKPTLSIDGSVARGLNNGSRPVGYNELDTRIMLNLSAPLYEGGRNQARQRAAAHALDAADSAVAYAQFQAQQTLQDALTQTVGQQQRAPVIDARISSIRTTRDLYREQYLQLGTRSLLDLLNAEQEFHSASLDRVESIYEVQRLAVECLYQSGRMRTVFELPQPVVAQGGVR